LGLDYLKKLYDYNDWANQRILGTTAKLSHEQFVQPGLASFSSIQATLVHTMNGQWVWLSRWQGNSPTTMFDSADFPDVAALRSQWSKVEQETQQFLSGLKPADLDNMIAYTSTEGRPFAFPLWQLLLHQVNHATQHRSEVAMQLSSFGFSPGWLDMVEYLASDKK
jgi:uncharacterized damage-inducible protein DinB